MLPFATLLADVPRPCFELDPVVLDAAGQVIGFWTSERLTSGQVIFPYRVKGIQLFGGPRPTGEQVSCRAAIELLDSQRIQSDIDVLDEAGRVWMRLTGWEDRRFMSPGAFAQSSHA